MKKKVLCSILTSALLTGCTLNAGSLQDTPSQSEKIQYVSDVQDHDESAVQAAAEAQVQAAAEARAKAALEAQAAAAIEEESETEEHTAVVQAASAVQAVAEVWAEGQEAGWYFFQFDRTLAVNMAVDGFSLESDGKALSDVGEIVPQRNELREKVDSILLSIITPEMTEEEKIAACYWYMANNFTYKRTYETPQGDWTGEYALEILTTGMGNCYRFASAFAYLLNELGYETKVITGEIGARQGGTTPHSWTEVKIENEWYVFDTELQYANRDKDYYWKTYETYPTKTLVKLQEWPVSF